MAWPNLIPKAWRDFIPTPPVIDFAWLKQWWTDETHKKPHAGTKAATQAWFVSGPGFCTMTFGNTKSEARATLKRALGLTRRLPVGTRLARMSDRRALRAQL
jgi:hypothetical protein